jgi:hypothetical protein
MAEAERTDVSTDEELSIQLHRLLIEEGHESVDVLHPIEGMQTITRKNYLKVIDTLKKLDSMTEEEKIERIERVAKNNLQKLKRWMKTAEIRYVDIADEGNFGKDISGEAIPMEGLAFTPIEQYPVGIAYQDDEVGAFIDEYMQRRPIRIVHKATYGLSDTMQQLADDSPPQDYQTLDTIDGGKNECNDP